jgi:hypothetical protein
VIYGGIVPECRVGLHPPRIDGVFYKGIRSKTYLMLQACQPKSGAPNKIKHCFRSFREIQKHSKYTGFPETDLYVALTLVPIPGSRSPEEGFPPMPRHPPALLSAGIHGGSLNFSITPYHSWVPTYQPRNQLNP